MAGHRRWLLSGLVGAALFAGCDPATTLFFLMPEGKEEPELKALIAADKKKEVTVVILTYAAMEPQMEFIQADRQIAQLLAKQMNELFRADGDKVLIIPPRKVEEFKNKNPSWHSMEMTEIGRFFKADYLIYLELNKLSLYEPGSYNQMLRGRAEISISVVDMQHPDDTEEPEVKRYVYPADSRGAEAVDLDTPPSLFRQKFLAYVAKRLSWNFCPHAKHNREVEVE
jgi:hypothetical protein